MVHFDTEWPADSVEFCPSYGLEHIFVCGTYKLESPDGIQFTSNQDEEPPTISEAQHRRGKCLVLETVTDNEGVLPGLMKIQEIGLPAVLDMKWCHRTQAEPATIAIADSEGNVSVLGWSYDENCLSMKQKIRCASSDVLCLSLDWSNRRHISSTIGKLAVSLSDRTLSILQPDSTNALAVTDTWHAHEFEPWITAWDYWCTDLLFSGGDDLKMKAWDCRQGFAAPTFVNKRFDAGVTSIQSHPFVEHLIAVGSYDNTVRLFDIRKPQVTLSQADVGGGAWRVKWHPSATRRNDLLVACMHDGFKVVRFNGASGLLDHAKDTEGEYAVIKRYDEHSSLAYGVDWSFGGKEGDADTLIASCSFYDHKMNVWRG